MVWLIESALWLLGFVIGLSLLGLAAFFVLRFVVWLWEVLT